MIIKNWNIEELTGYKPITTYYQDFGIAETFGLKAVKETFEKEMKDDSYAKSDYRVFTEFVMVLNWKIYEHYGKNSKLATLYNELWGKADEWAMSNLSKEGIKYFIKTTD